MSFVYLEKTVDRVPNNVMEVGNENEMNSSRFGLKRNEPMKKFQDDCDSRANFFSGV